MLVTPDIPESFGPTADLFFLNDNSLLELDRIDLEIFDFSPAFIEDSSLSLPIFSFANVEKAPVELFNPQELNDIRRDDRIVDIELEEFFRRVTIRFGPFPEPDFFTCTVWGDPHYINYLGARMDFQVCHGNTGMITI